MDYIDCINGITIYSDVTLSGYVTEKPTEKPTEKLSKNQTKIIQLLIENQMITREELALKLGIRSDTVRNILLKLKSLGKLKRIGPDKGGYWEVIT